MLDTCRWTRQTFFIAMGTGVHARPAVYCRMVIAALIYLGLANNGLFAQEAQNETAISNPANSPLAPVNERDQQVSQYDPLAQDKAAAEAKAKAQREIDRRRQEDQKPIPGSIADSETVAPRRAPRVEQDDNGNAAPVREYAGPAVLTRSYSLGQTPVPKQIKWTESVSIGSSYDTGAGGPNAYGTHSGGSLNGTYVGWNFGGGRTFAHDSVGFSTGGTAYYYPGSGFYTGTNQSVSAFWSHVINRHLSTDTSFSGALLSANTALAGYSAGPGSIANVNLETSPDIGIFDNGSKQGSLSSGLSWKINGRMSAGFNGSYFGVSRNSPLLIGVSGDSAGGNFTYRFTRKMTIGASYSFSQYAYPHQTQSTDSQSVGAIFSYSLGRSMQFRFNGGVTKVEVLGLQVVQIDPIIALLLGQKSGVVDAYQSIRSSYISAQFVKDFRRRGSVSFAYASGVTPGNGLFQTSTVKSMGLSYGTHVFRTYSLSFNAGRDQTSALVFGGGGQYRTEVAGVSIGHPIGHGASVNIAVNYRHFEIAAFSSLRNQLSLSSSVSWGNSSGRLLPSLK